MGCCSSRTELVKSKSMLGNLVKEGSSHSSPSKRKSIIDILAKGKTFRRSTLLNSLVETIDLKRAILLNIPNLAESKKFIRDTTTLDNKDIDVINFSALKVTKYFKNQKPVLNNNELFIDEFFPPSKQSLYGLNKDGSYVEKHKVRLQRYLSSFQVEEDDIVWLRATDIFIAGQFSIFTNDIAIEDVEQGFLGNCYFMSSIGALAPIPQTILQLFRTLKVTENGYYEVIMEIDREWNIVILDDYFPCDKKTKLPIFARPNGAELWAMLLEKAWAKINGGYLNIIRGQSIEVLAALTPFPIDRHDIEDFKDVNALWGVLKKASDYQYIMTCGTKNQSSLIDEGLIPSHGFTILGVQEGRINGELIRLLHIRNPYGFKEWQGEWSDKSDLWTQEARRTFGNNENKDDGLFYMSYNDFISHFQTIDICKVISPLCTKVEVIPKENLDYPNIYELVIYKQSKVNISTVKKSYRFHRKISPEDELCVNIILFSIVGDKFQVILTSHNYAHDPNIEADLPAGNYFIFTHVIYKYSKYDKKRKVKLYVTNDNYFDLKFKKTDKDYSVLQKIIVDRIKNNKINTRDVFQSFKNCFENTTYGYHYIQNNRENGIRVTFENKAINYEITNLDLSNGNTYLDIPSKDESIIIGFRKEYYEEFLYKIECKIENFNLLKIKNSGEPILKASEELPVNEDRYNFIYKKMYYDLSKIIEIIDDKLTAENYFLNKYPEDTELLLKIPESEDETKVYLRDVYDFEYHSYFGEWRLKGEFLPHGRGIYKFRDGSIFIGQIKNNIFDGIGTFIFPTGDRCEITFEGGVMHGSGHLQTRSGFKHEVEYEKGILVSKSIVTTASS
jgi:hypothetical protein